MIWIFQFFYKKDLDISFDNI